MGNWLPPQRYISPKNLVIVWIYFLYFTRRNNFYNNFDIKSMNLPYILKKYFVIKL